MYDDMMNLDAKASLKASLAGLNVTGGVLVCASIEAVKGYLHDGVLPEWHPSF